MREIKFRAWDNSTGKMYYQSGLTVCNNSIIHMDGDVMQYVGLKDKNGKEIYEGDILKHAYDDMLLKWVVVANDFGGYSIYNKIADVHPDSIHRYIVDSATFFIDREVIGNIHENPELL